MNNSILICQILQYFGLWLYDEKYTNYKLHPNHTGSNHWSQKKWFNKIINIVFISRVLTIIVWLYISNNEEMI